MSRITRRLSTRVAVIFFISIVIGVLLYSSVNTFLSQISFADDTEVDTRAVEQLLKLAQAHPTGAFPKDGLDPSIQNAFMQYSLKGDSKCWNALQSAVSKNSDAYTISATDPFRESGRDVDNSLVEVHFQDGSKIAFTFYQQTMVGCVAKLSGTK